MTEQDTLRARVERVREKMRARSDCCYAYANPKMVKVPNPDMVWMGAAYREAADLLTAALEDEQCES